MKILVIDDEKAIVESILEVLEEQKHEVTTAHNGREGLACLDRAPEGGFRLILLDLMMPVMDGERFLEALSERKEATTASVIVMTASQRIPTSVLPLRILRKPIELDYLLKMVEEIGPT
jgi:two-component system nitrogen regulation response regulator NtrX